MWMTATNCLKRRCTGQCYSPAEGGGGAVVQSVVDYEEGQEERPFLRAVVEGLADIEAGREVSIEEAKRRLGLS